MLQTVIPVTIVVSGPPSQPPYFKATGDRHTGICSTNGRDSEVGRGSVRTKVLFPYPFGTHLTVLDSFIFHETYNKVTIRCRYGKYLVQNSGRARNKYSPRPRRAVREEILDNSA